MKTSYSLLLILLCALTSACASTGHSQAATPPPAAATGPVVNADVVAPAGASTSTPETNTQAAPALEPAVDDAEADFAAIYGDAGAGDAAPGVASAAAYDPWEKYNRRVHSFNNAVDRGVAKPLAKAYVRAVPQPIRTGIGNFFDNLDEPVTVVNSLLQGNPRGAANALGRFLLNSTLGIGGLIDLADKAKMPSRDEDFGQTAAVWGWKRSRYIEVPLLGPRTLRDLLGLAADTPLQPLQYVEDGQTRGALLGLQAVELRAQLLAVESLGEGAVDEYALYRDVWLQRRNYQINQAGRRKAMPPDADLPPYLLEDGQDMPPDTAPAAPAGS